VQNIFVRLRAARQAGHFFKVQFASGKYFVRLMSSLPTVDPIAASATEEEKISLHEAKFVAPRKIDSSWDLTKIAHQHTLPEYDRATGTFVWQRDTSGATEILGKITTWQQSCPMVELNIWRVDLVTGRPTMRYSSFAGWSTSCEVEIWRPDSIDSTTDDTKARTRTMTYQDDVLVSDETRGAIDWPTIERKLIVDDTCGLMPPAPAPIGTSAEIEASDLQLALSPETKQVEAYFKMYVPKTKTFDPKFVESRRTTSEAYVWGCVVDAVSIYTKYNHQDVQITIKTSDKTRKRDYDRFTDVDICNNGSLLYHRGD
jgi:hypothetical protein